MYFSSNAGYICPDFAQPVQGKENIYQIFLSNVLIGKYCDFKVKKDQSLYRAPLISEDSFEYYDSVKGIENNSEVYVLYE